MGLEEYRRHAAECLRIADGITDPQNKMLLIAMARLGSAWPAKPRKTRHRSSLRDAPAAYRPHIGGDATTTAANPTSERKVANPVMTFPESAALCPMPPRSVGQGAECIQLAGTLTLTYRHLTRSAAMSVVDRV